MRTRLNEYFQSPDTEDNEYIGEGRALIVEAAALEVPHTEADLVTTMMNRKAILSTMAFLCVTHSIHLQLLMYYNNSLFSHLIYK